MKKTLLSIFSVAAIVASTNAQVFDPSATALTAGTLDAQYAGQVINVSIPASADVDGAEVAEPIVTSLGLPATLVGLAQGAISGQTLPMEITSTVLSVTGLPNGITAECDVTGCDFAGNVTGTITLSGTPTEAGSFNISILSSTLGTVDLSGLPSVPGVTIPQSFDLTQPIPGVFDEEGYTMDVAGGGNSIAEANDVFSLGFFPNPTTGDATLEVNTKERGVATVEVYSITGSRVLSTSESISVGLNRVAVDMNGVPAGIYLIKADINGEQALIRTQKI